MEENIERKQGKKDSWTIEMTRIRRDKEYIDTSLQGK